MQLRKNRFLKSFFVILIALEFLSPAVPSHLIQHAKGITHEINRSNALTILINLFSEQLNENEEGREDYKSISLICENHTNYTLRQEFRLNPGRLSGIYKTCHPYSEPALITMYCEYLI